MLILYFFPLTRQKSVIHPLEKMLSVLNFIVLLTCLFKDVLKFTVKVGKKLPKGL